MYTYIQYMCYIYLLCGFAVYCSTYQPDCELHSITTLCECPCSIFEGKELKSVLYLSNLCTHAKVQLLAVYIVSLEDNTVFTVVTNVYVHVL